PRQCEVDDVARAGDQVARVRVVHRPVVTEEVKEPTAGVDAARMIERERLADVVHEKGAAAKIRHAHHRASTASTSSRVGAYAPAAAAVAAAKSRCAVGGAAGRVSQLAIQPPRQASPAPTGSAIVTGNAGRSWVAVGVRSRMPAPPQV